MASKVIDIQITGINEALKSLGLYGDRATRAVNNAIYLEAEEIMAVSKRRVPFRDGILRKSGMVKREQDGSVTLSYGGDAKAYAWIQHEDLTFKHRFGEAKYLERPLLEAAPKMGQRIADRLKREASR